MEYANQNITCRMSHAPKQLLTTQLEIGSPACLGKGPKEFSLQLVYLETLFFPSTESQLQVQQ